MWKLKLTTQFKKDFRRILNQPEKLKALDIVLSALAFLLIWYDKEAGIIKLVRLGSHSELFSK